MIYDYLIVGAGVAGLYASLHIPKGCSTLILSKDPIWECNTFYAQGGISRAVDEEDIPLHIADTIRAGAGLCNVEAVEILARNSIEVVDDLIRRGFQFDRDEAGRLLFTQEAAHSRPRILHAGGDATGRELHRFLLSQTGAQLLEGVLVVDLLVEGERCYGVTVQHGRQRTNIYAKTILLASGGIGSLYEYHTNSKKISADIHGLAILRGLPLKDMEFTQFHPTVFVHNKRARKYLLTEALRGEGATVVDETGRRFLFDYDPQGELAPRDIVARAIFRHQQAGHRVYLSFERFSEAFFKRRFPTISMIFRNLGFNVPYDQVPISPAFHFMMGGIEVDTNSRVKGFENLYAIGEVACTGVHGANRLASNSLLEGLVFSKRAVEASLASPSKGRELSFPVLGDDLVKEGDQEAKQHLRETMWHKVGIIRRRQELQEARELVEGMLDRPIGHLLRLRALTARSIIDGALARRESIGAHYIED
ncbi:MAG: L-aspartate oxidase [Nitratiruptor sp.]|nr:L-aspartate oxidase [Nitratiruptor sp.]NPA83394.1 L-aspartate oxidase [Campylobacterota bacterium]